MAMDWIVGNWRALGKNGAARGIVTVSARNAASRFPVSDVAPPVSYAIAEVNGLPQMDYANANPDPGVQTIGYPSLYNYVIHWADGGVWIKTS